jgi:hypothetical protein
MRGGGEAAIIAQWVQLAGAETNSRLRGDYGALALVFAELTRARDQWRKALEGWNVTESQQVLERMAQGEMRANRRALRRFLEACFGALPAALVEQIEALDDPARLDAAIQQAGRIQSLADLQL